MNKKECPHCKTANNPSFETCWNCGQRFDQPYSPEAAAAFKKRSGYDPVKFGSIRYIFSLINLKIALWMLPLLIVDTLLSVGATKIFPSQKGLIDLAGIIFSLLAIGWWVKLIMPKISKLKMNLPNNFFLTGVKVVLYSIPPGIILSLQILVIVIVPSMIFQLTPLNLPMFFHTGPIHVILIWIREILGVITLAAIYTTAVRYLYIPEDNA